MDIGPTRFRQVTGVAVCSICLTWVSFILRAYVRIDILKFIGPEDWVTILTMVIFTIFTTLCLQATFLGLGTHMDDIPSPYLVNGFEVAFVCELLYVLSSTATKASVATYFLRLSSKKYQKHIIYANIVVVVVLSTVYFGFLLFQCRPVEYAWRRYLEHPRNGTCLRSEAILNITYAHSAMSALTDWVFGLLPISFVWNMDMNFRTKVSVVIILSLGFFASSATIVRIAYIEQLSKTTDYSWEGINLAKWSIVEPAIAITAMNLATVRPLFANLLYFKSRSMSMALDDDSQYDPNENPIAARHPRNLTKIAAREQVGDDFSDMLGLNPERFGVFTTVTAGRRERRFDIRNSATNLHEGQRAVGRELTGLNPDRPIPRVTMRPPTDHIPPNKIEVRSDISITKEPRIGWVPPKITKKVCLGVSFPRGPVPRRRSNSATVSQPAPEPQPARDPDLRRKSRTGSNSSAASGSSSAGGSSTTDGSSTPFVSRAGLIY